MEAGRNVEMNRDAEGIRDVEVSSMKKYIRIHEKDNVAVAIREIAAGETIEIGGLQVRAQERSEEHTSELQSPA